MILVCVKPVPDISNLAVSASQNRVFERGKRVINPMDEHAIEHAKTMGKETAAISVGVEEDIDVVRGALARGLDRGFLVTHPDARSFDAVVLARIIAAVARKVQAQAVVFGMGWPEGALGQVGYRVEAELGESAVVLVPPKYQPKLPSAMAIMKAIKKEITKISAGELGVDVTPVTAVKWMGLA